MSATNAEQLGRQLLGLHSQGMLVKVCTTPAITLALNQIAWDSNRSIPEILRFFIRKSEKDLGWDCIINYTLDTENWYDTPPIRTRLPRQWYLSLYDIAWKYNIHFKTQGQRSGGSGYLVGLCCQIQLKKHPVTFWTNFFKNGQDLVDTLTEVINDRDKHAK
jgi:hypothetical protein